MDQHQFKKTARLNVCTDCSKRLACADLNSICELVTPCEVCEIREDCTSMCAQMDAYLNRGNKREFRPEFISEEDRALLLPVVEDHAPSVTNKTVLWGVLNESDRTLLIDHFILGKSQDEIAKKLGVSPQRISNRLYGSKTKHGILRRLETYHKYQELAVEYADTLRPKYRDLLTAHYINLVPAQELVTDDLSLSSVYKLLQKGRKLLLKARGKKRG